MTRLKKSCLDTMMSLFNLKFTFIEPRVKDHKPYFESLYTENYLRLQQALHLELELLVVKTKYNRCLI